MTTRDIDQLFEKTKGNLFFQKGAGFLGNLLCKLKFEWTDEIETAAVSTTKLVWNPDFFLRLDKESRVTILAHELWHPGLLHHIRMGDRCPDYWNLAGDHVINNWLRTHGYYMGGFDYVMDEKFTGWSTNAVYDEIAKPGGKPMPIPMGGDLLPMDANGPEQKAAATAAAVANAVGAFATHKMIGGKDAGNIPGEVELVIDKFLNPKLPWETILLNFFNALCSDEYSYARPNRRYEDPLLPGMTGRNGLEHLVYYLDISGSITDHHILMFNSEVKFIWEELQPEKLTLVTFDTEIRDEYVFEKGDDFEKIIVIGRGGTDLAPVWDHAAKCNPTAMIVFTDLEVGIPENPGVPLIWVCIDNKGMTVPYGQLIHLSS